MPCSWHSVGASIVIRKTLRGFGGAGVVEIITDHFGDTFRTVLHVAIQGSNLRVARFPKEIEERTGNAEARDRFDQEAVAGS